MNDIYKKNIEELPKLVELTETQKKMITPDGNLYRYIGDSKIDQFEIGDFADISFPNGYGHGCRVHKECPTLCCATVKSLIIKVGRKE